MVDDESTEVGKTLLIPKDSPCTDKYSRVFLRGKDRIGQRAEVDIKEECQSWIETEET